LFDLRCYLGGVLAVTLFGLPLLLFVTCGVVVMRDYGDCWFLLLAIFVGCCCCCLLLLIVRSFISPLFCAVTTSLLTVCRCTTRTVPVWAFVLHLLLNLLSVYVDDIAFFVTTLAVVPDGAAFFICFHCNPLLYLPLLPFAATCRT